MKGNTANHGPRGGYVQPTDNDIVELFEFVRRTNPHKIKAGHRCPFALRRAQQMVDSVLRDCRG